MNPKVNTSISYVRLDNDYYYTLTKERLQAQHIDLLIPQGIFRLDIE